jgi:hypothetical protein
MAVLVTLLGVVLVLLGVLVAGLLRSHAEILRALHDLGVDLDPRGAGGNGTVTAMQSPTVRSTQVRRWSERAPVDLAGVTPTGDSVGIAVAGVEHLTLLAFLSTGCITCGVFWEAFDDRTLEVPGDARLVVVTKGRRAESVSAVHRLAPENVPVVMSDEAWDDYDVPVAPFFVLVDGESSTVLGEGAASTWDQVSALLATSLADAGLLDRNGRRRRGAAARVRGEAAREARADHDLLAAGIVPGDPSLYTLSAVDSSRPSSEDHEARRARDQEDT